MVAGESHREAKAHGEGGVVAEGANGGFGVNGAGAATRRLAGALRLTQTGYARTYALAGFLGAGGLLVYFLFTAN